MDDDKAADMPTTANSKFKANGVGVEVARDRVVCRWEKDIHQKLNYADEDLVLRILKGLEPVSQHRINHLSQKELVLAPGNYRVEVARAHRPEVEVRSSLEPTPSVTWIQDSPASQVVIWSHVNWTDVQEQVERIHAVDWETETSVALKVVWEGDSAAGRSVQWLPVPARDHVTLMGRAEQVELCVVDPDTHTIYKSLFLARKLPVSPLQVLANVPIEVPVPEGYLGLTREIIETDTLQVRAEWNLGGDQGEKFRLVLERDRQVVSPKECTVGPRGDYYFHSLKPGNYVAKLYKPRSKKAVIESSALALVEIGNSITLMPVDERRGFAYWHIAADTWARLTEKHGELLGRVRCVLRIHLEVGGRFTPRNDLSREVNLDSARDYYLDLAPDRTYKAQLVASIDGTTEEALTDLSNRCQLGRLEAGTNPLEHKWLPQQLEHPSIRPMRGPTGIAKYSIGYLLLHLHAHLPFVPDPIHFGDDKDAWRPIGYPQEWYAEAVRETYLPLLYLFERLHREGVDFKLSMDISPPVAAMMRSQRHAADVLEYHQRLINLARLEVERTAREEPHYLAPAEMHLRHLRRNLDLFMGYKGDLIGAFKKFQDLGHLEICTCVGTHPMLPLWTSRPQAMRGQILAAARYHEEIFGRPSLGVWLPECAYTPGVEPYLEEAGFRYFFSEEHTVTRGDCPAEFWVNAPVYAKGSQLAIFPRDPETGKQVWSGDEGYPGDADYLEFHIRGGPFKYNRITDRRGGHKEPYVPEWADNKASQHAGHFLDCRNARFEYLRRMMWKKPVIVAPYDAELFGHHWYEGPSFLYYLFKKIHYDQNQTELITPSAYLAANPTSQDMYPCVSSWGHKGTFEKWMYGGTSWMYRHAHEAADEMGKLAALGYDNELQKRVLAQAGRQLMLAMSSDLPFVISNGHFVDRMKDLFFSSLREFWRLATEFRSLREGGSLDEDRLRCLELENCVFPNLDPKWFANLG